MRRWIGRILLTMAVFILGCIPVCAAEEIKKDMVMETIEEVKLLEKAEGNATVVATLPAGTTVLITEDSSNRWCRVSVKEQSGYLRTTQLKTIGNKDELDTEFEKISNSMQLIFLMRLCLIHTSLRPRRNVWLPDLSISTTTMR